MDIKSFINFKIMKKISLKNLNLKEVEQLSRVQLKNVLGGYTGTSHPVTDPPTEPPPQCNCNSPYDCGEEAHDKYTCDSWCTGGTGKGVCNKK